MREAAGETLRSHGIFWIAASAPSKCRGIVVDCDAYTVER